MTHKMVDGVGLGWEVMCWYFDDLMISHRDEIIVSEFAFSLAEEFGPTTIISRGKVHNYLGMDLDFCICPDTMINSVIKYLQKRVDEFPKVLRGTKACPVGISVCEYCMPYSTTFQNALVIGSVNILR